MPSPAGFGLCPVPWMPGCPADFVLRQQALARGEDLAAFLDVACGTPDPLSGLRCRLDEDLVAFDDAILLHHHRIGAGRDRGAGEYPRGSACRERSAYGTRHYFLFYK